MIVLIVLSIITRGETFNFVMQFNYESYVFGDHFDSIMYSSDRPYSYWEVTYPPLITLVYAILGWFTIPYINGSGANLAEQLLHSDVSIFVFVIFMLVSVYILHFLFTNFESKKYPHIKCELLFFCVLFSVPALYAIQRGNCIFYAIDAILLFLFGFRSENKWIRWASYFSLAIAVNIKLYPALLAILILKERNYRGFVECILLCLAFFFGLFVFTDGNPINFFEILFSYASPSGGTGTGSYIGIRQWIAKIGEDYFGNMLNSLGLIVVLGFLLLSLVLIVIDNEMPLWQALGLLGCNMVLGIGISTVYVFMYLIPALMFFLIQCKNFDKSTYCITILFALIIAVIPLYPFIRSILTFVLMIILLSYSLKRTSHSKNFNSLILSEE